MTFRNVLLFSLVSASPILVAQSKSGDAKFINPPALSAPHGYTHVVVVKPSKLVYISGQVALNSKGDLVGGADFKAQATQAFENLKGALEAAGAKPTNIVKLNYYVVGLNHDKLLALREVRDKYIDVQHPPASTLAGVQALFRDDCQIEIEAVAAIE